MLERLLVEQRVAVARREHEQLAARQRDDVLDEIVPSTKRLAELARVDVDAAGPGGAVAWSADYTRVYARYMAAEVLLGVLVLVAVFFMVAKPFA